LSAPIIAIPARFSASASAHRYSEDVHVLLQGLVEAARQRQAMRVPSASAHLTRT